MSPYLPHFGPEGLILLIPFVLLALYDNLTDTKRQNRNRERKEPTLPVRRGVDATPTPVRLPKIKQPDYNTIPIICGDPCQEWFITDWGMKSKPSKAEERIIKELNKYSIEWHREVSFKSFMTPNNGHYRYDFYLPSIRTCIEYHGKMYHMDDTQIENDKVKEEFCRKNRIRLVIYRGADYYNMEQKIKELLSR